MTSVEFCKALTIDSSLIARLNSLAFSSSGTRRLCLHGSESSSLHVMLVESQGNTPFPCHFHADSDEVTVLIRGRLELSVWDAGKENPPRVLILGGGESESTAAHIPRYTSHMTRAIGGSSTYLEIKLGPFRADALVRIDPPGTW